MVTPSVPAWCIDRHGPLRLAIVAFPDWLAALMVSF
jgi:hypothetical protein